MKQFLRRISGIDKNQNTNLQDEEDELEYFDEPSDEDEDEAEEEEDDDNKEDSDQEEQEWLQDEYEEGQLSIDVFQTANKLIVKSTIAGVKPEDIDISINNDMLTIRGKREMKEEINDDNYLYRECYWGSFSRSIILPVEIKADKIEAQLENGVLTILLPKAASAKQISIKVKEK